MKLDAQEIEQLVDETERKRADWARAADVWESDWYGLRYDKSREDKQDLDGVDIVVSPDPFNVVQLLLRFVAGEQRIEVPSLSTKEDDEERSETMEEWLVAFDQESNRQQGRNHINDMTVQSGVLARGVTQLIWVGDLHEKQKIANRLPILRLIRDPRNCGVGRGAFGVDYGYHKYDATKNYIMQMYPKYTFDTPGGKEPVTSLTDKKHTLIDYYWREKGSIHHTVVIDHKFAKPPVKTDYPEVPFIEHFADGGPFENELGRSMSILHPIHELWKLKCDLMSKVATGLMYHYDPMMIAKGNFTDAEKQALAVMGPGKIGFLREGQSLDTVSPQPNVPMAQALLAMIQTGIDQATFPGVTYGDAPGGVNAGFAINNLNQQARSRVNVIRQNIETGVEAQNQQILGMIEAFAPEDGVEVYGRSSRGDRGKPLRLTKKIIKGNYANQVMLMPEQPMDDTQRILAWQGLVDKGIVSKELMRNRVVNIQLPRDEEMRVALEQALSMPEMQQKNMLRALQGRYKLEDIEVMIHGTPLEALWEAEKQFIEERAARKEAEAAARKQEKEQKRLEELLAEGKAHRMPDGSIMEGEMPMMPPLMPPSTTTPPPLMSGSNPAQEGPPPGMGLPPNMMEGSPPSLQPPGMDGLPPQMAGQMTPDMLGIPPGAPPGQFEQLMGGQPPTEEELLQQLTGGAPPPQF